MIYELVTDTLPACMIRIWDMRCCHFNTHRGKAKRHRKATKNRMKDEVCMTRGSCEQYFCSITSAQIMERLLLHAVDRVGCRQRMSDDTIYRNMNVL